MLGSLQDQDSQDVYTLSHDYMQTPGTHHVVQVDEGVVDGHHLNLATNGGGAGHQTANTSESRMQEENIRETISGVFHNSSLLLA